MSQHLCDWYSLTHIEHGILLFGAASLIGIPPADRLAAVLLVEAIWECIENTAWVIERYRAATISVGYYGDSIANSIGDVICCFVGGLFAATVPPVVSIGAVVAFEIGLVLLIRDSLGINVLMLVRPSETIRKWQGKLA